MVLREPVARLLSHYRFYSVATPFGEYWKAQRAFLEGAMGLGPVAVSESCGDQ